MGRKRWRKCQSGESQDEGKKGGDQGRKRVNVMIKSRERER